MSQLSYPEQMNSKREVQDKNDRWESANPKSHLS
jgi:hypothetical protein